MKLIQMDTMFDLEELLLRGNFASLSPAEQEYALHELGGAEQFDCARLTLLHAGAAMADEESELQIASDILPVLHQRFDARVAAENVGRWTKFANVVARLSSPSRFAIAASIAATATIVMFGSDLFSGGSVLNPADGEQFETQSAAVPVDSLEESIADSGDRNDIDSIISLFNSVPGEGFGVTQVLVANLAWSNGMQDPSRLQWQSSSDQNSPGINKSQADCCIATPAGSESAARFVQRVARIGRSAVASRGRISLRGDPDNRSLSERRLS